MKCPIDGAELVMTDRAGVEIDYCPQCRGVWLDRGELDKIIERSEQTPPPPPASAERVRSDYHGESRYDDRHDDRYDDRSRRKKKRGSLLGEIFDF